MRRQHGGMSTFEEREHPRTRDGRFTSKDVSEQAGGLGSLGAYDVADIDPVGATEHELREMARHEDPAVRVDVLTSSQVPYDVVAELADPSTQPLIVRHAVAASFHAGAAARAAADPSPVVRAVAIGGWDLDEATRANLANDAEVAEVLGVLRGMSDVSPTA